VPDDRCPDRCPSCRRWHYGGPPAGAAWSLPEVRWAATVLFAAGLVARVADGPAWSWWALFLACYGTGGWEPGLAGVRALREKVLDGGLLIVIFATSGAL